MASIKIILDKRKVKLDGTYPICFLICHNRKTTTRSAKIYVLESDWDEVSKTIKKSNQLHKVLNLKLKKDFVDIQPQLLLADDVQMQDYLKPVKQTKESIPIKKTIYQFASELIPQLKDDNKIGNAWVYESTVNALITFHAADDLRFEDIDYEFLTNTGDSAEFDHLIPI